MVIPLRKKTIVIIIVALVVIGGGLAGALIYFNLQLKAQQNAVVTKPSPVVAKTVCTNDTLTQAAAALVYPQDSAKLQTIATKIMENSDYNADVNCLYVVIQYDLAFSLATDARTNLNSLKGLYNKSIGYSSILGQNVSPPEVLEKMVANAEKSQAAFIKSDPIPQEQDATN